MERIIERPCNYPEDQKRLTDLWLEWHAAGDVRRYPTIWRLRLLLTSRVENQEKDTRVWETADGQITGLGMLWRRRSTDPYLVLDGFAHPGFAGRELLSRMLEWADDRAQTIARKQKIPLTAYANGFSRYDFSGSLLQEHGYALMLPNLQEHNVYFCKPMGDEEANLRLPTSYRIRLLQGAGDLQAYQALYGFSKVSPTHQEELMRSDEYHHLVVENAAGELAAYCECSVCFAEWAKTGGRIGWIDYIGTSPEQQGQGLGKVILAAGLLKLKELGAETAMLVTINTNIPAVRLYEKTGFEPVKIEEPPSYQKHIS